MSGATITFPVGEEGHTAVTTNLNLGGTVATDVATSYDSDNTAVCTVDSVSGVLDGLNVGTANIIETSVRGIFTHTDSGLVTITESDFTSALTFA